MLNQFARSQPAASPKQTMAVAQRLYEQRVRDEYQTAVVYYDPIWSLYDPFLYGPPYVHHRYYHVPVRRIYVRDHDRYQRFDRYERPRTRDHRR